MMNIERRWLATACDGVLGMGLAVGVSLPADADPPVRCFTTEYLPTTDGVYTFAKTTLTCPAGYGIQASSVTIQVQEEVLFVWTSRGTIATHTSTSTTNTVTQSYNCNGHGTDSWRTKGTGKDNFDRSSSGFSAAVTLTC